MKPATRHAPCAKGRTALFTSFTYNVDCTQQFVQCANDRAQD
jgi:hypothetical protein